MNELVVIIGIVTPTVLALWWAKRSFQRILDERIVALTAYYVKEKTDLMQNLPKIVEGFGDMMFAKIRGMVAGQASGVARLDQGLAAAVTQDVITGQNPMLGAILNSFPTAKKWLAKNPAAAPQVLNLLSKFVGPKAGAATHKSDAAARIARRQYG